MEVLGETGLDCALSGVFEHQAGHLVVFGQYFVLGERLHGLAAAFAGLDLEFALGTGPNDEVLQEPPRGDAGLEFGIGRGIGMATDIAGGLNEFVQRDRLDHGTYS